MLKSCNPDGKGAKACYKTFHSKFQARGSNGAAALRDWTSTGTLLVIFLK